MTLDEAFISIKKHGKVEWCNVSEILDQRQLRHVRVPGGAGAWQTKTEETRKFRVVIETEKKLTDQVGEILSEVVQNAMREVGISTEEKGI